MAAALQDTTIQSIFAGGDHRAGWKKGNEPASMLDVASPPRLVSPGSSGGHVGFQLGMGLRKSRAAWGKYILIHPSVPGESRGVLTPKASLG